MKRILAAVLALALAAPAGAVVCNNNFDYPTCFNQDVIIASGATLTVNGTFSGCSSLATDAVVGATATTLAIGNTTSTAVSIGNSAACDTILIGTNTDADTITIGESNDTAVSITDDNWSISAAGVASFAHLRHVNGTTITASGALSKATLQAADVFLVDSSAGPNSAVDIDFGATAMDAADVGSEWKFIVSVGTGAVTVTAGAGVTTVATIQAGAGASVEDPGDMIVCTLYTTTALSCYSIAAD